MKELVTANDIKRIAEQGKTSLNVGLSTIITPAARDAAKDYHIQIIEQDLEQPQRPQEESPVRNLEAKTVITTELIAKIVGEVLASLPGSKSAVDLVKEADPSGLRLVKGSSVVCEKFNTGNASDKVGIKEILTKKESPSMSTGFMTFDRSSYSCHLEYEEVNYIIDGTLEIKINGSTYRGTAGDVFYLPKNTTVTYSTPNTVKFFFVTYPAK